jgi:hypothetical protein
MVKSTKYDVGSTKYGREREKLYRKLETYA